jgi:hypothetical protein
MKSSVLTRSASSHCSNVEATKESLGGDGDENELQEVKLAISLPRESFISCSSFSSFTPHRSLELFPSCPYSLQHCQCLCSDGSSPRRERPTNLVQGAESLHRICRRNSDDSNPPASSSTSARRRRAPSRPPRTKTTSPSPSSLSRRSRHSEALMQHLFLGGAAVGWPRMV